MSPVRSRLVANYGMVGVLALLCLFFSIVTVADQPVTGAAAARQVTAAIGALAEAPRVLIVTTAQPDDVDLAGRLSGELRSGGARVLETVQGEPRDVRQALERLVRSGEQLDAVACTTQTANWLVLTDLPSDFPALGRPAVVSPRSYRWPNFLKSDNLLNIANQIAVIAILAIGMTIVIITGGIDLSVGSVLALTAVLAARLIRDAGGGEAASAGAMVLACVCAIAVAGGVGAFSGLMITRFQIRRSS